MRSAVRDEAVVGESDDLLTTGEVAKILNSSRQHVVDLCNSGELPYTTVGKHRRIRRRDVEMLRNRSLRMSRDQRRSLWLNTAVAGRLVADPSGVLNRARSNLDTLQAAHPRGQAAYWLEEWAKLLDGPTERVLEVLTSPTPWAREMRQNSPFSGVLDDDERVQVLTAFRGHDKQRERTRA
jgi:excisionase family DNA binding protein